MLKLEIKMEICLTDDDDDDESGCKYVNVCDVLCIYRRKMAGWSLLISWKESLARAVATRRRRMISIESATTVNIIII